MVDHQNTYYNNEKLWNMSRITIMWCRDMKWVNVIGKMVSIDLTESWHKPFILKMNHLQSIRKEVLPKYAKKSLIIREIQIKTTMRYHLTLVRISLVQLTLCDPMDCSMSGFPVRHQLLELVQTHVHWVLDAIQLSCPMFSPSPPAFSLSQHQGLF